MQGQAEHSVGTDSSGWLGPDALALRGGRIYLERGRPVTVIIRWSGKGPRNVLIRREDGQLVVRPFRGLRKP